MAAPEASTAPATVSGERLSESHWAGRPGREGGKRAVTRESGDRPCRMVTRMPSGVTAKERNMNAMTQTAAKSGTTLASIIFAALIGATIIFFAGHAQSATLHDAAHDMRHATGFPCH